MSGQAKKDKMEQKLKQKKLGRFFYETGRHWRIFANFWMLVTIVFFILSFFYSSFYESMAHVLAVIYLAVLSIYAGTKECSRWHHYHKSIHFGEFSVLLWTILVILMIILNIIYRGAFNFSNELIALYIAVLGIFAITQNSKALYRISGRNK